MTAHMMTSVLKSIPQDEVEHYRMALLAAMRLLIPSFPHPHPIRKRKADEVCVDLLSKGLPTDYC